jgi:hypothetical protein
MGLLRNLAKKVVGGVKAVREEAKHPGRPPTFKASENPFVREPEEKIAHDKAKAEIKADAKGKNAATDKPWYLDGQNDGWDETNPGEKKE